LLPPVPRREHLDDHRPLAGRRGRLRPRSGYRLHEVGERLASGADIDWVRLAGELGYADQAHFIRDFTAMVGETPTHYAARYPGRGQRDSHH